VSDSPDNQQGGGSRKPRRGNRRRRGRRNKGPRNNQDQDNRNDNEGQIDLPDDPEELMAMSRPLGLLEVLGSGSGLHRRREAGYTPSNDDIYVARASSRSSGCGPATS
jgi:transcription termination factor Rho